MSSPTPTIPNAPKPLLLRDAPLLLQSDYLPFEAGYSITTDGMHHIAASTYMPGCTGAMVDWWFGYIETTPAYLLWHPRDHVSSAWEGPRNNDSTYIGGHHLVREYIGGVLASLKISFCDPAVYFGADWKRDFERYGYSTAVCGRVAQWDPETGDAKYGGHLIHLVKDTPDGCRMRSRFWLGDGEDCNTPEERAASVPPFMPPGLAKHATEEMAILANILPALYVRLSEKKA